jgi:hypothetical protein
MSFIIVWRNNHRDPFVDVNSHYFLETYSTYEQAKEAAEAILSEDYFDYQIYEEVSNT